MLGIFGYLLTGVSLTRSLFDPFCFVTGGCVDPGLVSHFVLLAGLCLARLLVDPFFVWPGVRRPVLFSTGLFWFTVSFVRPGFV